MRGNLILQAHREHFYQRATGYGLSHARVSILIACANILLIILAVVSLSQPFFGVIGSIVVVICLLVAFHGQKYKATL
jgi:hypothetical protein